MTHLDLWTDVFLFNCVQEISFLGSLIPVSMDQTCQPDSDLLHCAVELLHSYNLARQDGYIVISGPDQGEIDKQYFQSI